MRVDGRSGQATKHHDDAFWLEHERRRVESGLSARQYCASNGLALSTYRLRLKGIKRAKAEVQAGPASRPAFVAIGAPRDEAATVEVAVEGMTVRLYGAGAERVLRRVMERLT
jgi:hypothetical protein